jgi:hypothetical protein
MKAFKTRSKFVLKNVVVRWYGEITLKVLKGKTHKFHKNKNPFTCFNYVPIGHKKIDKPKKLIQKDS